MATMALGLGAGVAGSVLGGLLNRPTAAQKALNAQMQDFNNYVNAEAKTEGFDSSSVFQNLMGPLQRIVQGGPQQAGWSQSETNAYNTQAMQRGAAQARDLGSAAASRASSIGGGDTPGGGSEASARLQAQQQAESATSSAISQGTIQSDEAGRQEFNTAVGDEKSLPSVFDASNSANRNGIDSNQAAQKSQQALDTANKGASPLGMLSKGLSGIGGAASSPAGMQAVKSLAGNNNASVVQNAMNTPVQTTTSSLPDQLPVSSDNG